MYLEESDSVLSNSSLSRVLTEYTCISVPVILHCQPSYPLFFVKIRYFLLKYWFIVYKT